jgi:hypothetical protein
LKYLQSFKKVLDENEGVSTVSRETKLSSKSRLFNTQTSRQKWKKQITRTHQPAIKDIVPEDTQVEQTEAENDNPNIVHRKASKKESLNPPQKRGSD